MKQCQSIPSPGILALLLLGLCIDSGSAISKAQASADNESLSPHRASQIQGSRVESPDRNRMGRVDSLVMDLQTGQVAFIVVAAGGFLGVMAELRPVPPEAFSIRDAVRGIALVLDLPPGEWEAAPSIGRRNQSTHLGVEGYARPIYEFYGHDWDKRLEGARRFEDPELPTMEEAPAPDEDPFLHPGPLRLADDLRGLPVTTRLRHELGEIEDFLIHLEEGRILFALIRPTTRFWERTDTSYAVTPQALVVQAGEILLHFDPRALAVAPILLQTNLAAESSRQGRVHPAQARERPVVFRYQPDPQGSKAKRK
jgi:sporulation protein YlmC with PRC-barrel domain